MNIEAVNLFFEYEEAVQLYIETHNPALRLRAIVLRRQFLDLALGPQMIADIMQTDSGTLGAPRWLAESDN